MNFHGLFYVFEALKRKGILWQKMIKGKKEGKLEGG